VSTENFKDRHLRRATVLASICVFGFLMGLRTGASSIGIRAGIAAAAAVALVMGISLFSKRKTQGARPTASKKGDDV